MVVTRRRAGAGRGWPRRARAGDSGELRQRAAAANSGRGDRRIPFMGLFFVETGNFAKKSNSNS
jgi:hypothetical protein